MESLGRGQLIRFLIATVLITILFVHKPETPNLNKQIEVKVASSVQTAKTATPLSHVITAVAEVPETPEPTPQPTPVPTTHEELMAAAGISPEDYGAVDYIVSHESGWNADATEPTSGAHGLPQALPYSKTGCGWSDAVCQLVWANTYAISRYGGWWPAQAYWAAHGNW